MHKEFEKHIDQHLSFLKEQKLLVAVSGGIDSVVLVHLLHQLGFEIGLAHCNFKLRGKESDLDAEFVQNLAKDLAIECYTTTFNTKDYASKNGVSIQMAARDLRYDWFKGLLNKHTFNYILTAHHKDDVLETFLINLTRGTGLDGLTGIPEINKYIVRPLLPFSRNQIESFAKENDIKWREDQSNTSTKYIRNKIRHEVIPVLKELNPSLLNSFESTISHLKDSQQIINDSIEQIRNRVSTEEKDRLEIDIEKIKELSNPKIYLYELLKEFGFTEWNDINDLLDAQSGKQLFSHSHRIIKDRTALLVTSILSAKDNISYQIKEEDSAFSMDGLSLHFEVSTKTLAESNQTVVVDKELLKFPLIVRKWQKGDYFCPIGMQGKKKLSKFFKDEKYSLLEKEQIWLLCTADNTIVWIIGKRLDNRFKVTAATTKTLKITLKK